MKYWIAIISLFLLVACKEEPKKQTYNKEYKESLEDINKYLVSEDSNRIANYAARKEWNMQVTKTGLWYQIYHTGEGKKAELEKIATLKFRVELLDGTICYDSDSVGNKRIKLGKSNIESGLTEGLLFMKTGDKARLILPPYLNYGLIGDEYKIPPRSIIVYDIELIDISDY